MTATPLVAVVNRSTVCTDADVKTWAAAINRQVREHFCPAWGLGPVGVRYAVRPPAGAWIVAVLDNSDQADALGYHDLSPTGLPIGKVFAADDAKYGDLPSVTLSHEVLELIGDPWLDRAAEGRDGFYAYEACDPVEADALGYNVDGVRVSDFCLPAWWGYGFGHVDYAGHLTEPWTLAEGGYCSLWTPRHGWSQRFGQAAAQEDERKAAPPRGSRRERRARARHNWQPSSYDDDVVDNGEDGA